MGFIERTQRLRALGIFEHVEVVCDEGSEPTKTRVRVDVKERNAFTFKAGSFVGPEELNFVRCDTLQ
jgi:outer membrane protein assembly factor BamA